jgi:hypothetical protein
LVPCRALIDLSNEALRTDSFPEENGLFRQITHDPVGVVYVIVSVLLTSSIAMPPVESDQCLCLFCRRRGTTRS